MERIHVEYFRKTSLLSWLNIDVNIVRSFYNMWNGFIRSFSWISKYLAWRDANGNKVCVGVDPFLGGDDYFN